MKKLIAIAVVFALVMGGVFAETSISGSASGRLALGTGMTGEQSKVTGSGDLFVKFTGENEDGTFGGELMFGGDNWSNPVKDAKSNVWWKPIDMLKVQIGSAQWGTFGIGDAKTGWNVTESLQDLNLWIYDYNGTNYYGNSVGFAGNGFGGYDGIGLFLSVYPISGLEFNMAFPFKYQDDPMAVYKQFYAEVGYNIDGIGKIMAGFQSDYFDLDGTVTNAKSRHGGMGVSFDLSALQGKGLDLAFKLHTGLPTVNDDLSLKRSEPLNMAIGGGFATGDFKLRFRFAGEFLGKTTNTVDDSFIKDPANIRFGLCPLYNISGDLLIGVSFDVRINGLGEMFPENPYTTEVYWHTSPAIQYSVGPGKFRAGVNVGAPSSPMSTGKIQWEIPIQLGYSF